MRRSACSSASTVTPLSVSRSSRRWRPLWADVARYTWRMADLFSVPLGYVDPGQGSDDGVSISSIPPEVDAYPGKYVALRRRKIVAAKDTLAELLEELGDRRFEVSLFQVPTTRIFAR